MNPNPNPPPPPSASTVPPDAIGAELADEINRAPAKVQSALLEVMEEHQVTIGGRTFAMEARASDSPNAPARFAEPLPGGTEVTIAEVRGSWARVVLADDRDAWVRSSALERVAAAPPAAEEDRAGRSREPGSYPG